MADDRLTPRECAKIIASEMNAPSTVDWVERQIRRTQPQWISVEKELPETMISVLVIVGERGNIISAHRSLQLGGWVSEPGTYQVHPIYWMPLPAPPEGA